MAGGLSRDEPGAGVLVLSRAHVAMAAGGLLGKNR